MEQTRAEVTALRESVQALSGSVDQLVSKDYLESVRQEEERKRRNFGLIVVVVGVCFLMLFVMLAWGLYSVSGIYAEQQRQTEANRANLRFLVECTTPGTPSHPHPCYDAAMKNQNHVVDEIVRKVSEQVRNSHH